MRKAELYNKAVEDLDSARVGLSRTDGMPWVKKWDSFVNSLEKSKLRYSELLESYALLRQQAEADQNEVVAVITPT